MADRLNFDDYGVCRNCGRATMTTQQVRSGLCEYCSDSPRATAYSEFSDSTQRSSEVTLPARYSHFSAKGFETAFGRPIPSEILDWAAATSGMVGVYGPAGSGKTGAAVVAARRASQAGNRVVFYDAASALEKVRDEHIHQGFSNFERRIREIPFLVLDDLGIERSTEYAVDVLGKIVRHRHAGQLSTLVTTNVEIDEWFNRNDQIARRLFEDGAVRLS